MNYSTKAAKKREAKFWLYANSIRVAIEALPDGRPGTDDVERAVVEVFKAWPGSAMDKGDAFYVLDSKPGEFFGYAYKDTGWHSKLRRTRNNPTHGRALFATFKE